jgi:predicted transcriptional regulator
MTANKPIVVDTETKSLLDGLKIIPDETYNSVIKRLALNAYDFEPLNEDDIQAIEEGLRDYAEGKYYTEDEVWGQTEKEESCTQ